MSHPAKVIDLYDSLLDAKDDRTRAKIIASAFESLEDRYPELRDMATASGVRETELRLQKEIEQLRADLSKDIEQVRADLSKDIEQLRADLSKEIEQVRADLSKDIEQVRLRIEEVRADLSRQIAAGNLKMLFWTAGLLFAQMVTIVAVILGVTMG
jgi:archaellum component FlaC